jgi:hypothetical protein
MVRSPKAKCGYPLRHAKGRIWDQSGGSVNLCLTILTQEAELVYSPEARVHPAV